MFDVLAVSAVLQLSLSARRAWIEMQISVSTVVGVLVALRKESVDRNLQYCCPYLSSLTVALRKESVDRNDSNAATDEGGRPTSLSARRAWIEMIYVYKLSTHLHCRSPQGERG